jgi:hypothetical protein
MNLATNTFQPDMERNGYLMGYGGGLGLGLNMAPGFSLDTDFLYMRKGSKVRDQVEWDAEVFSYDAEFRLDYFVINPMLRFSSAGVGARPFLTVGTEFGILLKAEEIVTDRDTGLSHRQDVKDELKDTDLSLTFGGGLEFRSQTGTSFFLEGRYSLGLTEIAPKDETTPPEGKEGDDVVRVKNRGIYLMAGLRF